MCIRDSAFLLPFEGSLFGSIESFVFLLASRLLGLLLQHFFELVSVNLEVFSDLFGWLLFLVLLLVFGILVLVVLGFVFLLLLFLGTLIGVSGRGVSELSQSGL